jgi:hypothetical protein
MRSSRRFLSTLLPAAALAATLALAGCNGAVSTAPSYSGYVDGASLVKSHADTNYPYGILASVVPSEHQTRNATIHVYTTPGNVSMEADANDLCRWITAHPGSIEKTTQAATASKQPTIKVRPRYFDHPDKKFTGCK